jgi:hypothetical protein
MYRKILAAIFGLLLIACDADNMYSSVYCNFVFLTNLYPSCALTRAVGSGGGDFCIVKATVEHGVTHLKLTPNRGTYAATDLDLTMSTAITAERISYASMGRRQGLIIGRSVYGQLRAYDLLCPNCNFDQELRWAKQVTELVCDKCERIYNIDGENGYVKSGDKGRALDQYKNVYYSELDGRLVVRN